MPTATVQGSASFSTTPDRAWLESIRPRWEHFLGPIKGGLAGRWLEVYYWQRVAITIDVRRIIVWPTRDCAGEPVVLGEALPGPPPPQSPPRNGTGPRTDADRLATDKGWVFKPEGGRRAGLTAHRFEPRMIGQEQRLYTGWLDVEGNRAVYAPHTRAGYRLPASKVAFTLGSGIVTRRGIRKARERGLAPA